MRRAGSPAGIMPTARSTVAPSGSSWSTGTASVAHRYTCPQSANTGPPPASMSASPAAGSPAVAASALRRTRPPRRRRLRLAVGSATSPAVPGSSAGSGVGAVSVGTGARRRLRRPMAPPPRFPSQWSPRPPVPASRRTEQSLRFLGLFGRAGRSRVRGRFRCRRLAPVLRRRGRRLLARDIGVDGRHRASRAVVAVPPPQPAATRITARSTAKGRTIPPPSTISPYRRGPERAARLRAGGGSLFFALPVRLEA